MLQSSNSFIDTKPLVSVILPVYNGAEFVGFALDSALCQTWRSIEIIVVDDGSTDATPEVLKAYASRDSRIRVITQANSGVARARNQAIGAAHGEFIAPLDADDLWLPNKIELQVGEILSAGEETGLVYSWWAWINEDGVVLDRSPRWSIVGHVFELLLQINFTGNASIPLFRKRLVIEAGGYNEDLAANGAGGCEDWELVLRIAARYRVAVVPEILLGYRRRNGSMSTAYEVMRRSHQRVMHAMRILRPDVASYLFDRSDRQFAMYLAGLAFWGGNYRKACEFGLQSGWRLPALVAPHVLRMIIVQRHRKFKSAVMVPGGTFDSEIVPAALIPYDRVYRSELVAPPIRG